MNLTAALSSISSLCFIVYGVQCLVTERMRMEFERYRAPQLRKLTGILQVLAGIGLIAGLHWRPLLTISSGGLVVMMICALAVRIRIKDTIVQSLPAFGLLVMNGFIVIESVR